MNFSRGKGLGFHSVLKRPCNSRVQTGPAFMGSKMLAVVDVLGYVGSGLAEPEGSRVGLRGRVLVLF